jgi:hypothetical protein
MQDQEWNYLIRLSGTTGEGSQSAKFEQLAYSQTLMVAFQEIIDLDLRRFANGKVTPGRGSFQYDQATITYQPTGELVATTRNIRPDGNYFPAAPGLYLQVIPPIPSVEQTLGIGLKPVMPPYLPAGYLLLGNYGKGNSKDLRLNEGVDKVSEEMMVKRWAEGQGMYQLEIERPTTAHIPGSDVTYHFEHLKDGLLALTNKDLSDMNPAVGERLGPAISNMRLSFFAEPLIEVERHPKFLAFPVTGVPGIYYTVPHKDSLKMLSETANLDVLPHFELGKHYFQVAAYQQGSLQPSPIPALDQLRGQLQKDFSTAAVKQQDRYALELYYHNGPTDPVKTGRAYYGSPEEALQKLVTLAPVTFDTSTATTASPRLESAQLLNVTSGQKIATMYKAAQTQNGPPSGIYISIESQHLTPTLTDALGPVLDQHRQGSLHHFLVARSGQEKALEVKHHDRPRALTSGEATGKHL